MKKTMKKLAIHRDTVRALGEGQIQKAAGATGQHDTHCLSDLCSWDTCNSAFC